MKKATQPQLDSLKVLFKDVPSSRLQRMFATGLLADARDCPDPDAVDHGAHRRLLGVETDVLGNRISKRQKRAKAVTRHASDGFYQSDLVRTPVQRRGGRTTLGKLLAYANRRFGTSAGLFENYEKHRRDFPVLWQSANLIWFPAESSNDGRIHCLVYDILGIWVELDINGKYDLEDEVGCEDFVAVPKTSG